MPTPTVNVTGTPADTSVVGPASVMPVRGLSFTVTVAVFPATLAVTMVSRDVVRAVRATPFSSVTADVGSNEPLSAVNVTGMPVRPKPETSSTRAEIVVVPPDGLSTCGVADSKT
jgi:hypothetical protein